MKRLMCVLVVSGLVAAAALVKQPTARAGSADTCGEQGQPACPMQAWMEKFANPPIDDKDLKALEIVFERSAKLVPDPKWNEGDTGWAKLAHDGAAAARSGDFAEAKKLCKSCHKVWREKYREQFRTRPIREEAVTAKPSPAAKPVPEAPKVAQPKPAQEAHKPTKSKATTKKLSKQKAGTKKQSKAKTAKATNKKSGKAKAGTKKSTKPKSDSQSSAG